MVSGLPDPEKSRAVLIGMPDYEELEPLPAVAGNVRRLKELLGEPDLWGLPDANCRTGAPEGAAEATEFLRTMMAAPGRTPIEWMQIEQVLTEPGSGR